MNKYHCNPAMSLTKQEILEAAYQSIRSNFTGGRLCTISGDTTLTWTKTDILECLQDLIREDKATMSLADDYNAAMKKERDEAVNLLTAICELVKDVDGTTCEGEEFDRLEQIKGLKEWWAARKPKSEREQKLEKVKKIIEQVETGLDETEAANRILSFLEQ